MMQKLPVVHMSVENGIGLLAINNPPVNALGFNLRSQLIESILAHTADPSVRVIAIYGEGPGLSAGADIREFGKPPLSPYLSDILNSIETNAKPVIAVLHGITLGGGLELALACHARVALPEAQLGLPEVTLGLLPGAGGTQRLPRLVPLEKAIDIIISGRRVSVDEALTIGLVGRIIKGSPRDVALIAGADVLQNALEVRPTGSMVIQLNAEVIAKAKSRLSAKPPLLMAPHKALEAIGHADKPIAAGLKIERQFFLELMDGPDRQGLIHAFNAERLVKNFPEATAKARAIERVGIVGGGTMGVGIATSLLQAGIPVTLVEMAPDRVDKARTMIAKHFEDAVNRHKFTAQVSAQLLEGLRCTDDITELADVSLVIEAIFEDTALKQEIFTKLDAICKPSAVLATNTSYLDVNLIAAATQRPQDVIGLHFFSPAYIMRLLEVVVANQTSPEVVATALSLAKRTKKVPVRSGVCDGFIGNRILAHYRKVADYLLLDGASFEQIDRALEQFGFAMGPFAVADLAGLDIGWATRKRKALTRPTTERYVAIADRICELGHLGVKTGRGYYRYDASSKTRTPNPEALQIIELERAQHAISPRSFSDDEILARYLTAMISEAARVIEEGIATRPIDVDAVFLFGYGFPRHLGGPMNYADRLGVTELIKRITCFANEDPHYWQVPALLHELAATGRTFSDLNKE